MPFKQKPLAAALCLLALPLSPVSAQEDERSTEAIVVTANRQPTRSNDLLSDVSVIERKEIEAAGPNASITDLLARQPGLEIKTDGGPGANSAVYIRGSNVGHTLVLVDGLRVGSATLGAGNWSYLPLQQVERIEILRGAASSLYGSDAIGGVQSMIGGKVGAYVKLAEAARQEAYDDLIAHAQEIGANAILAMRYDANEIMPGVTEVLAYGTAVVVEPV